MGATELTEKQRRFCEEYTIDLNATQAAIRAGYSEKTSYSIGQENLKKPEIQTYIKKFLEEVRTEKIATQQEVMSFLSTTMRDEDAPKGARIRAAEILCKTYKLFTDGPTVINEKPAINLTKEEIAQMFRECQEKYLPELEKNRKRPENYEEMKRKFGVKI